MKILLYFLQIWTVCYFINVSILGVGGSGIPTETNLLDNVQETEGGSKEELKKSQTNQVTILIDHITMNFQ